MKEIPIISEGKTISRILTGRRVEEAACLPEGDVFLVYDRAVEPLADAFAKAVTQNEGARFGGRMSLETSESGKTLDTVMAICRWLLEAGADRRTLLVALGGGITTDMAGFAASIYKRGIRFAYIPTTLLAQVDAAIGGKTGVNFLDLKNMLGVIRQPEWTWICPEPLQTLPGRYFRSGAAEMLKTFLLGDAAHYAPAVSTLSALYRKECDLSNREAELEELIAAAAAVKAAVVGRDPFEKGERRKLNLGHTFAHGLETRARQTGKDLTHGEAVAIGMVLAARLSERMGLAEPGLAARLKADFEACGLPTESPFGLDLLAEAMKKDKKADGGIVHFILPVAVGTVVEKDLTVAQALEKLKES